MLCSLNSAMIWGDVTSVMSAKACAALIASHADVRENGSHDA